MKTGKAILDKWHRLPGVRSPRAVLVMPVALVLIAGLLAGCGGSMGGLPRVKDASPEALRKMEARLAPHEREGDDPAPLRLLGRVRLALDDVPGAEKAFVRALELAPLDGRNLFHMGLLHLHKGKPRLAIPLLEQAVELGLGNPRTLMTLAGAHEAVGDLPAALAAVRRNILRNGGELAPRLTEAQLLLDMGRHEEARTALLRLRRDAPSHAMTQVLWARLLLAEGRTEEVTRLLEGMKTEDAGGTMAEARGGVAVALLQIHRAREAWPQARALLRKMAETPPLPPEARLLEADVLEGEGQPAQAEALLKALAGRKDTSPIVREGALVRLARHHVLRGDGAGARALLEAPSQGGVAPLTLGTRYWSAAAWHQLDLPREEDALSTWSGTASHPAPEGLRIAQLLRQGERDRSGVALAALLSRNPGHPGLLLLQVEHLHLIEDHAGADILLAKLRGEMRGGGLPGPWLALAAARAAYLQGEMGRAAEEARGALEDPWLGWRAAWLRAMALLHAGKADQALSTLAPLLNGPGGQASAGRLHALAGNLHWLGGNQGRAERVFRDGLAISPGQPLLLEGLSALAMAGGNNARAMEYLRQGAKVASPLRPMLVERLRLLEGGRNITAPSRAGFMLGLDPLRGGTAEFPAGFLFGLVIPDYPPGLAP